MLLKLNYVSIEHIASVVYMQPSHIIVPCMDSLVN